MSMTRRNMLKFTGVTAAAAAMTGCGAASTSNAPAHADASKAKKHQVVIIGGGWGGLTVAKQLKKIDDKFDVVVLEKNDRFMSCPFSNTYLGKLDGVELGTLVHDYAQPQEANGYKVVQCEVVDIDRNAKVVYTSQGPVKYEYLVLSPGISYNYKAQFPEWSDEKIEKIKRTVPAALIPGAEHVILERMLADMDDGNVIITKPSGKYRCPPAPFERACMIANYMKKEGIRGKVIILNEGTGVSKGAAFKEAWAELYGDIIEHRENCKILDIDPDSKEVHYEQTVYANKDDIDGKKSKVVEKYQVFNFIPTNAASPVVAMSGVETTSDDFGKVLMNGCSFRSKTDANIFAVGDVVGHGVPPSGQTAIWAGTQCAQEIGHLLHGKTYELPVKKEADPAGNVCYSMVGEGPEEAILVKHEFSWNGTIIVGKGHVPKDPSGKFRGRGAAMLTRNWYEGAMRDLFS